MCKPRQPVHRSGPRNRTTTADEGTAHESSADAGDPHSGVVIAHSQQLKTWRPLLRCLRTSEDQPTGLRGNRSVLRDQLIGT